MVGCIVGDAPNSKGVPGSNTTSTGRAEAHMATSRSAELTVGEKTRAEDDQ